MAESAKSKKEFNLVSSAKTADTIPSAQTAHCGKEQPKNALPDGTELMSTVAGFSAAEDEPAGECESELT